MTYTLAIDHIVVTAPTLAAGLAHVRSALGVEVPAGGRHTAMGTHNHVMRLGTDVYLEVIAIDPDAPHPGRPRWFGLDRVGPSTPPRLATWIVRTSDLDATLAALSPEFGPALGPALAMSRDALSWRISVPDDGSLPFDGAFPTMIGWPPGPWPGTTMPNLGPSLTRLVVEHPRANEIAAAMRPELTDARLSFADADVPSIRAEIMTAGGPRWIS